MRILRRPEVRDKTGLTDPTLDRKEQAGEFPKRIPLGTGRAVGWLDHEVDQWIKDRVAARDLDSSITGVELPLSKRVAVARDYLDALGVTLDHLLSIENAS